MKHQARDRLNQERNSALGSFLWTIAMAVVYDPHLQERLRERHIPEAWPREIIEIATERYQDAITGVYVAIDKRWYKGKEREMAASYVEQGTDRKAITIHPIHANQKRNRIEWVKV